MSEKQKNVLYAVITVIALMVLFHPFSNLRWDEAKRYVALLCFVIAGGGIIWHLLKKKAY